MPRQYSPSGPCGVPMDPDEMLGYDAHVCEEFDDEGRCVVCHEVPED